MGKTIEHRENEHKHIVNDLTAQLEAYETVANHIFKSTKAVVESRLTPSYGILPESVVLGRDILDATNNHGIEKALYRAVDHNYHPGVRPCSSPQIPNSPWVMGIKSHDDVKQFIKQKYPEWLKIPNLTEIIVMHNFPGLSPNSKDLNRKNFIFSLWTHDNGLLIEAKLDTTQLRDIESILRADMISIRINNFMDVRLDFGANYTLSGQSEKLHINQLDFQHNNDSQINPQVLNTINGTLKHLLSVFVDPQIQLSRRLEALANCGLEITEWQGQFGNEGDVNWMRIYGLKGSKDDSNWVPKSRLIHCQTK